MIATKLYFMPDVEVVGGACKGQRFNAEVLDMSIGGRRVLRRPAEHRSQGQGDERLGARLARLSHPGQSATTLTGGGEVVARGMPADIAASPRFYTWQYRRARL